MRLFHTIILLTVLLFSSAVRAENGVFENYTALRAQLDDLIMRREIKEMMLAFGGSDEITPEELDVLQGRVRSFYASDFEKSEVLRVDQMGGGWRQELIAYWTQPNPEYIYVRILIHDRGTSVVAAEFDFNSSFREIIPLF